MASYMNVQGVSNMEITEEQFNKMLSILGISVRHQFIVDVNYNGSAVSDRLGEKYENIKKLKSFYGDKKRNTSDTE